VGFYSGQWLNYLVFRCRNSWIFYEAYHDCECFVYSLIAPGFPALNFTVWPWANNSSNPGLMETYALGVPFYRWSIVATILFSTVFFGAYYLLNRKNSVAIARVKLRAVSSELRATETIV
jgi:hypothetical protein